MSLTAYFVTSISGSMDCQSYCLSCFYHPHATWLKNACYNLHSYPYKVVFRVIWHSHALSTCILTFLVQNAGNQAAYFSHSQDLAHGPILFDCSFTALVDHFPLGLELLLIRPSHDAHCFMLLVKPDDPLPCKTH